MVNKITIRRLLTSLVHRRQKLHDMHKRLFSGAEARAVSVLSRELGYRERHDDTSHVAMVRNCADYIRVLLPGRGTRFLKFREQLLDMLKSCQS